jgi:D-serine deaminase-like pyridoxal phosphate-dependent protein
MQVPALVEPSRTPPIEPFEVRGSFDTPCLLVDLERVEANVSRMAATMRDRGVALRPHAKTHKSRRVADLQLAAGAVGLTVGTLGEAEVLAGEGRDVFLAYPLWPAPPKVARLRALLGVTPLTIGLDSAEAARRWATELGPDVRRLRAMVEVDSGGGRTGVVPSTAGELARVAQDVGIEVQGVFTHGGHGYARPGAGAAAADDERRALAEAAEALRAEGIEPAVLSAGSTPTAEGAAVAPVTEVRPGTYVFQDRQQVGLGSARTDAVALVVAATVVSDAVPGQVVVDAGGKALSKDRAAWLSGFGEVLRYPEATIERLYDYHGVVRFPESTPRPKVGSVLLIAPNHVCPVVDLAASFLAVRDGELVGRWPVDARGRSA